MRKTRYAAVAFAAAAALTLSACGGDSGNEAGGDESASGEKITIGIKFDQPGVGFMEGGEPSGFDVDVAKYVAEELGYSEDQIEWKETPTAQRENVLENGEVDMIFASYSINETRKERVAFAGPYFIAGQDLLVNADNSDIKGPEDLNGKTLCSVTGSTSAQKIKDTLASDVKLLEQGSYANCVTAMQGGQIDVVTTDDIILAGLASTDANAGKFKVVGNPFTEEQYGVGISKESTECEAINTAIRSMIEDGSWEEAIKANTEGADYAYNDELNPPEPAACA